MSTKSQSPRPSSPTENWIFSEAPSASNHFHSVLVWTNSAAPRGNFGRQHDRADERGQRAAEGPAAGFRAAEAGHHGGGRGQEYGDEQEYLEIMHILGYCAISAPASASTPSAITRA